MTTATRSLFTEAIEDHLTLKKQNSTLSATMPIARFDVGDPLDRYPGGPVKQALGVDQSAEQPAADETSAAATAATEAERAFRQPMNGMTPMLSLVEDVDEDELDSLLGTATATAVAEAPAPEAEVVRFPGGVGPRDIPVATDATAVLDTSPIGSGDDDLAGLTGEQPVIVIDADEPIAPPAPSMRDVAGADGKGKQPSFFNLKKRRKAKSDDPKGAGWFSQEPRDFRWDD